MGHVKGSKQVSVERRNIILDMNDMVVKQCDIASYYKMPRCKVCNIIKRVRVIKVAETRGRKPKFSRSPQRIILRVADNNRFKPSHVTARDYNKISSITVCTRTVRRCLHSNGIRTYTALYKSYLSPKHLKAKMQWSMKNLNWAGEEVG